MDREALEKLGYTNLQQMFEKNPAAGNGTCSTRGNNQDSTANGTAAVSLRGIGADNALDEEPPFAIGDGDSDLYGYVSSQHDPRGRFVYGKMVYSF